MMKGLERAIGLTDQNILIKKDPLMTQTQHSAEKELEIDFE